MTDEFVTEQDRLLKAERSRLESAMKQAIESAVAAERERCARIAEDYPCMGRSADGTGIADKIRSGKL